MAFSLEVVPGRPWHQRYALLWKWKDLTLIRLFPMNVHVLVDKSVVYRYVEASDATYLSAVQMDTHRVTKILNYRYLLDWMRDPPIVRAYPAELSNETDILNHLSRTV